MSESMLPRNNAPLTAIDADVQEVSAEPTAAPTTHALRRLHMLLRGRYHWAAIFAVIGTVLGTIGGYLAVDLKYQSVGVIRINPNIQRILDDKGSGVMPMFSNYVASQVELMRSARVLQKAQEDDAWKQLNRGLSPEDKAAFRDNLIVKQMRSPEMISVIFIDEDLRASEIAVKAVIRAYMQIYGERDSQKDTETLNVLEQHRAKLTSELNSNRQAIYAIARQFGNESLDKLYDFRLEEQLKIEQALRSTQMQLAEAGLAQQRAEEAAAAGETEEQTQQLSPQEIALRDGRMRQYLQQRDVLQTEFDRKRQRFGRNHRTLQDLEASLATLNEQIKVYAEAYNRHLASGGGLNSGGPLVEGAAASAEMLKRRHQRLEELYERVRAETLDLGQKSLEIKNLQAERESIKQRLAETNRRIETLNLQAAVSDRIETISEGEPEPYPVNAGKRKQLAVLGGMGGGFVGLAMVVLIGLFDRRLRTTDDTRSGLSNLRLLGILPQLPERLDDPEQATITAYCVHHIRTLLQISGRHDGAEVFAITSPASGTGKTSLTFALGMSFAGANTRTLLIDADLAAGGLTSRLGAILRRRIGQILLREGLVHAEQLEQALAEAQSTDRRLGEVLVKMGILRADDISQALSTQEKAHVGLLDALEGEPVEHCVTETGVPGLYILPIGSAEADDISRVSPTVFRRVLEQVRGQFDTILIDTGPVPGSIETSIVAAEADQVILVVSRGEQKPLAERAVGFLDSIGATSAGVVFNRAAGADLARSVYSGSMVSRRPEPMDEDPPAKHKKKPPRRQPRPGRPERVGPLVRALAPKSVTEEDHQNNQ